MRKITIESDLKVREMNRDLNTEKKNNEMMVDRLKNEIQGLTEHRDELQRDLAETTKVRFSVVEYWFHLFFLSCLK